MSVCEFHQIERAILRYWLPSISNDCWRRTAHHSPLTTNRDPSFPLAPPLTRSCSYQIDVHRLVMSDCGFAWYISRNLGPSYRLVMSYESHVLDGFPSTSKVCSCVWEDLSIDLQGLLLTIVRLNDGFISTRHVFWWFFMRLMDFHRLFMSA